MMNKNFLQHLFTIHLQTLWGTLTQVLLQTFCTFQKIEEYDVYFLLELMNMVKKYKKKQKKTKGSKNFLTTF